MNLLANIAMMLIIAIALGLIASWGSSDMVEFLTELPHGG